jgi:hypothetical protein
MSSKKSTHVKKLFVRSPNKRREDSDYQNLVFIEVEDECAPC